MRALVTGGAGFIGSNLVDALLDRGDDVTIVDNLSTGRRENLTGALERGARFLERDIRHADEMLSLAKHHEPEVFFHLAAQIDVRVSTAQPAFDAEVNVLGTVNMLDAAREGGARRFIYISTGGAIYGEADNLPTPESAPIHPEAPYGQAKFSGEGYCQLFSRLHSLSTVSLRLGNVYGPRQDPLGEAGVVAIFCGRLLDGGHPTVFGDGEQTRDYVFVADVVGAMLAAADSDATGSYNVGRGHQTSVLNLVEALSGLGGELGVRSDEFKPEFAPPRAGEVRRSALDPSLTKEKLGFTAQVSVEDGLRQTLQWAKSTL